MDINSLKQCVAQYTQQNELVVIELKCSESNQIDITIDSLAGVSLEKCIELNKHIESQFNRDDEDYSLTVSSASISEPLSHPIQFQKNMGREVEVMTQQNEKIVGVLCDVASDSFSINYSKKVEEEGKKRKVLKDFTDKFGYQDVKKVTLVIKF